MHRRLGGRQTWGFSWFQPRVVARLVSTPPSCLRCSRADRPTSSPSRPICACCHYFNVNTSDVLDLRVRPCDPPWLCNGVSGAAWLFTIPVPAGRPLRLASRCKHLVCIWISLSGRIYTGCVVSVHVEHTVCLLLLFPIPLRTCSDVPSPRRPPTYARTQTKAPAPRSSWDPVRTLAPTKFHHEQQDHL